MGSRSAPAKAIAMGALMIVGLLNPAVGSDFRLASGAQTGTAAAALSRINVPPLGTPVGKPLKGHTARVEAVAVGKRSDGTPVIVSAGYDKTVRIWDLDTGKALGKPLKGHKGEIYDVAVGRRSDGTPVIVSGAADDIRIWDLNTGKPIGKPLKARNGLVHAVTTGRRGDGTPVIISSGDALTRDVEIWNLDTGKLIGKPSVDPFAFTVTQLVTGRRSDGTPVFVTGATNGRARIWNMNTGKPLSKSLSRCGTCLVEGLAVGKRGDGTPVAVTVDIPGSPAEEGSTPKSSIRIWNLDTGKPIGESITAQSDTMEVAVGQRGDGSPVIVSGDGGGLSVWDLDTGARVGGPFTGDTRAIFALAIGKRSDGTPVAISSGLDKTIRVWSLGS
ncbi:WD40 repeat domain-containing protein [Nonomuraea jabiensis]|uniref:WD40 repeat protein n=1 Tax=Nonomuraea jabiensis TaxID=882448 RepID=A0A7W9L9N0_9ACTN|nr:hypothetical protein [Nonomuraea jabiensis]MBB5775722.1 WD40 repeat protein [Nonomuraea jabiensis]